MVAFQRLVVHLGRQSHVELVADLIHLLLLFLLEPGVLLVHVPGAVALDLLLCEHVPGKQQSPKETALMNLALALDKLKPI